jgi:hypothetical protein
MPETLPESHAGSIAKWVNRQGLFAILNRGIPLNIANANPCPQKIRIGAQFCLLNELVGKATGLLHFGRSQKILNLFGGATMPRALGAKQNTATGFIGSQTDSSNVIPQHVAEGP